MKCNFKILIFSLIIFCNNNAQQIYVNSIPKCGTHLLTKCITLITKKKGKGFQSLVNNDTPDINNNEFFFCHMSYSADFEKKLKDKSFKTFFIYRDPRDQVVSNVFWTREKKSRYEAYGFKDVPDIKELTDLFITHINNLYSLFLPWKNNKDVCSIKFENLVGPEGSGDFKAQRNELRKICNFLDIKKPKINFYANNLFGGTGTFREGQIGRWKQHFSQEQKNKFKEIAGQLLIDLGYEKDLNW